jgi:hypothetical protein
MPSPDATGTVTLIGPKPGIGTLLAFGIGFAVISLVLWYLQRFNTHALLLPALMLSTVAAVTLAGGIRAISSVPVRLVIDTAGISWSNHRGKTQRMLWPEMREVRLVSDAERTGRYPLGNPPSYLTTQISALSDSMRINGLNLFGIAPMQLAAYLIKCQHAACPEKPAILEKQMIIEDQPARLQNN